MTYFKSQTQGWLLLAFMRCYVIFISLLHDILKPGYTEVRMVDYLTPNGDEKPLYLGPKCVSQNNNH